MIEQLLAGLKKKRVILRAPVFTLSGYGTHARQIATWLIDKHDRGEIELFVQALNWGHTPWVLDAERFDGLVGRLHARSMVPKEKADVSIQLQLPNEWDPAIADVNIGVTAAVESDRCNPAWVVACNRMTHVVVPSQHIQRTLAASGPLTVPVTVVPEAFPSKLVTAVSEDVLGDVSTSFNFLVFGQITGDIKTDRKNTFLTLKWLSDAFAGCKDVGIVLKTNMGRHTKIDRMNTVNALSQTLQSIRGGKKAGVPVHLVHGELSEEQVKGLYTHPSIKALVTATRGEGWGLPILEAAACALPIIATDWSGHLDFMNEGKFIKLAHDLKNIPRERVDNQIWVEGSKWAEVREDDFKRKVAKFRESPTIPKQWATELATKVQEKFSLDSICKAYEQVLGSYLRQP